MATAWVERRLAAILAADVVRYSHLVEQDEAGTLSALKDLRREVIEPLLAVHHGRIVKLMGDGAIAEFGSVVDAVACAVGVQKGVAERQANVPAEHRIVFRIGINLGDVVVEGEDLLGDGVNVAARLEQLCEPAGVLVSGAAYDQLQGKLDLILDFVGEQRVKNISRPVRTYRVRLKGSRPSLRLHARRFRRWVAAGAAALVLLVIGPILWRRPWEPRLEPASVERMALPLPDKPSIAVLPFANLSGDPEQEYFVDGMTEDLITDLSKVAGLFVVARNSVFPFKGRAVNVREVAEKLGVRYVLEGSVRRAGDQVRVNAQLIDATTGGHLWAERHDGSAKDIFAVQDQFVQIIVQALALNLSKDEQEEIGRGQTKSIAAREAFQRGWELYLRFTPEENAWAAAEMKSAIALDPNYGRAYAALALVYFRGCAWEWNESLGMSAARAAETADLYLREAKSRPSSLANVAAAHLNLWAGKHDDAFTEAARALALDPNDPEAHLGMAWTLITTGKPQAGLEFIETAMRLNPNYPSHYALARGIALFAKGDLDEAARAFARPIKADPHAIELAPPLAATYAHLGRRQEARELVLMLNPGARQSDSEYYPVAYHIPYRWSAAAAQTAERLIDGLTVAALPMGVTVPNLITALEQGTEFERTWAAKTLGQFGSQAAEAVSALIRVLADGKPAVRWQAIIALKKIGPAARAALPALAAIQDDDLLGSDARDAVKEIENR
ncbi:tetratricopeptide repeat protein [Microvirga tunisiensis]|uniref:Tetratricopeptide repeat protein n=1 Tax=Microvirga tunisiensis TaxID=2108360 RepID=A0A5N7MU22_9HYPH|nr:tetratricopeptide repeat protein [Microvirga tunisiensis]MPR11512.1 tetratricopeptide repeat protein [Microvirga tunisiensis]MPR29594.1 tetratricopeptide repeat protein [Microvirga tunisiensis]